MSTLFLYTLLPVSNSSGVRSDDGGSSDSVSGREVRDLGGDGN